MIVFVFVVSEAQETALMTGGFNGYEGARLVSATMMIMTLIQIMMKQLMVIITIITTRPKPPSGRQGLAGSWGKDTVRQVHYKMFSTSHFAPTALSSNWILLLNVVIKTHL